MSKFSNLLDGAKENMSFERIINTALQAPLVNIDRETFLRKELSICCSEDAINEAVQFNPAYAGVKRERIDIIAKQVIDYETTKVTALSVAASLPSSVAIPAAIAAAGADITSYFVFILRAVQELAYLYGFPEFDLNDSSIDSVTMNYIMIFLGTMFGVQGAQSVLGKAAESFAAQTAKSLAKSGLTKGAIYPLVKSIAKRIGIRMTTQIFADTVASAIPFIGSGLSGALTYAAYKPNCLKLQKLLREYDLSDPSVYHKEG